MHFSVYTPPGMRFSGFERLLHFFTQKVFFLQPARRGCLPLPNAEQGTHFNPGIQLYSPDLSQIVLINNQLPDKTNNINNFLNNQKER